ncbi:hypothetical protein E2562_021352 [Oryza meyeriana var. granulata]|uniref:Uncharacterized protein n=1 Tax=Oryza meyeriana var. granulata TaxID=110450 RepID=A0A6G1CJ57_9ORYZ|nr:hypothetical protein E2562_021352 [Oryza meyeriana var. granulata]
MWTLPINLSPSFISSPGVFVHELEFSSPQLRRGLITGGIATVEGQEEAGSRVLTRKSSLERDSEEEVNGVRQRERVQREGRDQQGEKGSEG